MTARDLRLAPAALAAWAAALVSVHVTAAAPGIAFGLWCVVAAALLGLLAPQRRRRGATHALVVTVLAAALAAAAASHVAAAAASRSAADELVDGGRAVDVVATVIGKVERRADGRLAFDAAASTVGAGAAVTRVGFDVVVIVAPEDVIGADDLDVRATIEARGTARESLPGRRAALTVSASRGVSVVARPSGVLAVAGALRAGLVASATGLPAPGSGLIPGLAVGDTSAVAADLDDAMKASSLSHLTAVSGANCALVVGLAFAGAALAGARRGVRVGAGFAALVGFVVLVTPEPSVVRAAAMASIAMLGVLLGRPGAGVSVLSMAIGALLVVDPWLAASLGFALSAVATASLLLFARPLARGLGRILPRSLALALSVPLAAQLACGPLLVLITPVVPTYGVAANLLAAPAAPIATIVGLAACLAAPLPWLQDGLTAIAWLPAAWIAGIADTVETLPAGALPWLPDWPGAALLAVVGGALLLVVVSPRSRALRGVRAGAAVVLAVAVGATAGAAAIRSIAAPLTVPGEWSVLACDVGQGDAVLVRSEGRTMLVDTGPEPEPLAACLARAGVGTIDLLVVTHFDRDHAGGIAAVEGRVGTALHGPAADGGSRAVLDHLAQGGARLVQASRGQSGSLGGARWRVLWPRADAAVFAAGNDASVVVDVAGGGVPATLLLGDLSEQPQRALAASGLLAPSYEIVKVAHHGSADQFAGLYSRVHPALALVTVGAGNDYGHPRDEALDALTSAGATIARTDTEGTIAVWTRGDRLAVWREREGVGADG